MKLSLLKVGALALALLVLGLGSSASAHSGPVAKLTQVVGTVEYSKNAKVWRRITRTKYLFVGHQIRTGDDSSAKVINQETGLSQDLGANSLIAIRADGPELIKGVLSEPEEAGGSFWAALQAKFTKAQRYTTVRRKVSMDEPVKVATSRNVSVSQTYPELVWENVGAGYAYRLTVDADTYDVPVASTGEMIRYRLPDLTPGDHKYIVQITLSNQIKFTPQSKSTLTWLSAEENREYLSVEREVREDIDSDEFLLASFMEEHGFLVPAMDTYREYFMTNQDDNDMRPLLIKVYSDLMLFDLKEKEAIAYNAVLLSEES